MTDWKRGKRKLGDKIETMILSDLHIIQNKLLFNYIASETKENYGMRKEKLNI